MTHTKCRCCIHVMFLLFVFFFYSFVFICPKGMGKREIVGFYMESLKNKHVMVEVWEPFARQLLLLIHYSSPEYTVLKQICAAGWLIVLLFFAFDVCHYYIYRHPRVSLFYLLFLCENEIKIQYFFFNTNARKYKMKWNIHWNGIKKSLNKKINHTEGLTDTWNTQLAHWCPLISFTWSAL